MNITRLEEIVLPFMRHPARWVTMDSGHQILALYKPGEVAHLQTVVRTGSVNETDADTGISHFLEHLMFKGSERFPAGEFDRLLEGIGARVNAATSKDWTYYYLTLPKGFHGDYYRLALDLHADMLLHAMLPEEEIGPPFDPAQPTAGEKRERMVVIEEIKMSQDNPWRQAITELVRLLYPTHPYRREVIGTADVIARVSRDTLYAYYRTWYQPANMITVIAGELDPDEVVHGVSHHFQFASSQPVQHPVFPPEQPPSAPRITHLTRPLNVAYVVLGFLGPPAADLRAGIALDVLSLVLGEGISSRLQQRLVEQLPNTPFFDVGSAHWTNRDNSNVLAYGIVRPDAVEQSFTLLQDEVNRLHKEPPAAHEFEKAITRLEAHFATEAETSAGIAGSLAYSMALTNSLAGHTDYLPTLHSLTRDDLARYTVEYLSSEHLCAVTVAPQ